MKVRLYFLLSLTCVLLLINGCNLKTTDPGVSWPTSSGNDLVISEIFKISPSQYYAYSWIEIYNPVPSIDAPDSINYKSKYGVDWKVEYKKAYAMYMDNYIKSHWYAKFTPREHLMKDTIIEAQLLLRFQARLRFYLNENPSYIFLDTTFTAYFSNFYYTTAYYQFGLPPGYLEQSAAELEYGRYTLVMNNRKSFDEHIKNPGGPADPKIIESGYTNERNDKVPLVLLPSNVVLFPDQVDTIKYLLMPARWDLLDNNEVSLIRIIDTVIAGVRMPRRTVVVDMVRFENYRMTNDFSSNQPLGHVPEGSSVARYAGYFATGNTADEFYIEPNPVPGYGSLMHHP
jgi:hypothetical protein